MGFYLPIYHSGMNYLISYPIILQINTDIPRTFPTNIFFREKDPKSLQQPLFNVLLAFSNHNKSIGYCQGMNYVAGMFLLVTKSEDKAFWLMKTIIEDILPDYYSPNLPGLLTDIKVFTHLLRYVVFSLVYKFAFLVPLKCINPKFHIKTTYYMPRAYKTIKLSISS